MGFDKKVKSKVQVIDMQYLRKVKGITCRVIEELDVEAILDVIEYGRREYKDTKYEIDQGSYGITK